MSKEDGFFESLDSFLFSDFLSGILATSYVKEHGLCFGACPFDPCYGSDLITRYGCWNFLLGLRLIFFGLLLFFDQPGTSAMEIKEYLRSGLNFTFCMGRLHVPPRHVHMAFYEN